MVHKNAVALNASKNICLRCKGEARPIDGRPQKTVNVGSDVLEIVSSFCYLGDMQSAAGGCTTAAITRVKSAWSKFNELLPVLTSRHLSLKRRGHLYHTCVRRVMLHASETWPLTKCDLLRLQRNDRAMIRRICGISFDKIRLTPSKTLLAKIGLADTETCLRDGRLRWFGHVKRSSGAVKTVMETPIQGRRRPGRPHKTWNEVIKNDIAIWGLGSSDPMNRATWKNNVKSAMRAASQDSGKRPIFTDDASQPAR